MSHDGNPLHQPIFSIDTADVINQYAEVEPENAEAIRNWLEGLAPALAEAVTGGLREYTPAWIEESIYNVFDHCAQELWPALKKVAQEQGVSINEEE